MIDICVEDKIRALLLSLYGQKTQGLFFNLLFIIKYPQYPGQTCHFVVNFHFNFQSNNLTCFIVNECQLSYFQDYFLCRFFGIWLRQRRSVPCKTIYHLAFLSNLHYNNVVHILIRGYFVASGHELLLLLLLTMSVVFSVPGLYLFYTVGGVLAQTRQSPRVLQGKTLRCTLNFSITHPQQFHRIVQHTFSST